MPSPTQKSLALLRAQGYTAEVVERWLPRANVRKDLFGFIDLVAMNGDHLLAVQTTTLSSYQQHVTKLKEKEDFLGTWLESAGKFEMHCWGEGRKAGKPYKRLRISLATISISKGKVVWHESEYIVKRGYELEERT